MTDVPITFMGELDGEVYRVGMQQTVFQHDQADISNQNPNELKRTNSQIMKALNDASATQDDSNASTTTATAPEERRGLPKVRSGINIASIYVEAKEG